MPIPEELYNRNLGTFVSEGQLREYLQCEDDLRNIGIIEEGYNRDASLEGGCVSAWQQLVWEFLCATQSQSSWEYWYMINPRPHYSFHPTTRRLIWGADGGDKKGEGRSFIGGEK